MWWTKEQVNSRLLVLQSLVTQLNYLGWLHTNMAKPKSNTVHIEGKPKTTSIGQGQNSRPERRGKKKLRGQGK